ncbi:MAG: cyclic pyranopterin monophosphate synthase MoaC [Deltaproteobacteria bacterium]|nr:cyclic pyranopterin monophosphate synthase MoaC [Deltaproteobacteria bacterium]
MGMIDITEKPVIKRLAEAAGKIILSPGTVLKIKKGQIKKGDPLLVAEIAAMNTTKQTHLLIPHCHQIPLAAMNTTKQTHLLIPHCHQIPLDTVKVSFDIFDESIEARCLVRAQARTGVEMEALVGVSMALNTVWDMVKYLEKDDKGQYPKTRITDIRVIKKEKGN